jgi:hypothetical protein
VTDYVSIILITDRLRRDKEIPEGQTFGIGRWYGGLWELLATDEDVPYGVSPVAFAQRLAAIVKVEFAAPTQVMSFAHHDDGSWYATDDEPFVDDVDGKRIGPSWDETPVFVVGSRQRQGAAA